MLTAENADPAVIAARGRNLVVRLLDELDATSANLGEMQAAIVAETGNDETSRRRDAMLKAVGLKARADTLKALALAAKTLNGAIKTTERKLAGGEIEHEGSALMAWVVGNAKAEARGNAVVITKQAAGSAKIDPLMGIFDAVTLMATNPTAPGGGISDFLREPLWA